MVNQWTSTRYPQVDLNSKEDHKDKVNNADKDSNYPLKRTNEGRQITFVSFVGNQDITPLIVVPRIRTDNLNNREISNKTSQSNSDLNKNRIKRSFPPNKCASTFDPSSPTTSMKEPMNITNSSKK
jgi:hypothetical protein